MTVLITLTLAGADTGPYDLFSDVDGFTTPFETSIQKVDLLAGFLSSNVPDFATVIKVLSKGSCASFINLSVQEPTTTTTSTSSTTSTTTSSTTTSTTTTLGVCTEYVFGTFSSSAQAIKYTDCDGFSQTAIFGGSGVYQEITICLVGGFSIPSETFVVSNNGACVSTTSTTTTIVTDCIEYEADGNGIGGTVEYVDCLGTPQEEIISSEQIFGFCALEGSVVAIGGITVAIIGPC